MIQWRNRHCSPYPLLITWLQKLLTPNQDALMIILQDSDFGKTSSPITAYFEYLDKLDERISVAVRHRAVRNPKGNKGPGHKDDRNGDGGKKYGTTRTLVGAYELNPPDTAGCTMFCKTGLAHKPAFCPRFKTGEITMATLHKKKLCVSCLGPKTGCPQTCKNKTVVSRRTGKTVWKTCKTCNKSKSLQIHTQCSQGAQGSNTQTPFVPQPRGRGGAATTNNTGELPDPRFHCQPTPS